MWFSIHRCVLGIVFHKVKKIISQYELFKNPLHLVNKRKSEVQIQTHGFAAKLLNHGVSNVVHSQMGTYYLLGMGYGNPALQELRGQSKERQSSDPLHKGH